MKYTGNKIFLYFLIFGLLAFANITLASLPYQNFAVDNNGNCVANAQLKVNDPTTGNTRCVNIDDFRNYLMSESSAPTPISPEQPAKCYNTSQTLMLIYGTNQFRCVNNSTYQYIPQELRTTQLKDIVTPKSPFSVSGYRMQISIPCQPLLGGQCPSPATPAGYIARIYQFGLMIVGFAAFTMIIYGGVLYVFAAGDITKTSDAKDVIQNAIYGLVLFLGSYLILYTINPRLVDLRNPELEFLQIEKLAPPPEPGETAGIGSASGEKGNLCKLTMSGKIGVSINTVNSGTNKDLTGNTCISCVDNAIKDSSGKCACEFGFAEFNGTCTSYAACKAGGGTVSEGDWSKGQAATCNISGGTSASSKDKPCTDFGGTCQMTDNPNAPGFYKGMCLSNPSPNYLCYKP